MITASLLVAALAAAPAPPADDVPLQARLERLVELVERDRRAYRIPGAALGVIIDGEVVLAEGLGVADLSTGAPVTPDTVFAIGSVTKSFTAVLAGMLAEDGLLDLDDPLDEHFEGVSIPNHEDVTVRQALGHCTGLANMPLLVQCSDLTPDELREYVARAEPPLTNLVRLSYSNVSFALGGEAIARAGGAPWHELVRERILAPLGMDRTTTTLAAREAQDDVARGYDVGEADEATLPAEPWDAASVAPAAALSASLDDTLAYARMLALGGRVDGRALIGEDTLEDLWREFAPLTPPAWYGAGFVITDEHGPRIVHHPGNMPGYAAQVAVMPDEDAAVVLLTNVMVHPLQEGVLGHAAACLFDDELPPVEPLAPYPTDLELYTGRFRHTPTDSYIEVFTRDGRLFLDLPGEVVHELLPPDDDSRWRTTLTDDVMFSFPDPGEQGVLPRHLTFHRGALSIDMWRLSERVSDDAPPLADLLGSPIDAPLLVVGTRDHPHQGVFGDLAIHVGRGRTVRETRDLGRLGEAVVVVDGARGWERETTGHVRELAGDQLVSHLASTAGVFAGRWHEVYASLELRDELRIDREDAYLVRATRADGTSDGLVFAADGRLLRLRTSFDHGLFGWTSIETHFDDWREVGGRLVPFSATSEGLQFGRIDTSIELVLLDAPVPADAFEPLEERR